MILKRLTSVLTVKRKTSTDRIPTGFLQNNSVATPMIQNGAVTPVKLNYKYDFFDAIVGSASQVTNGLATHSSVSQAITDTADGGSILVLPGNYIENVTISKKLYIFGKGHTSNINGTVTFTSNSDYSIVKHLRIGDNITLNAGADGIFLREFFLANGKTVTDNGTANSIGYIQE